ncbi:MAG: addiction module toxin RelE [Bacteroidetes bacterium]|nr:addiction module toxin RelE [Bacteroidota bacterium]
MSVKVISTENFQKEAKKLLKKYISLKGELDELEIKLIASPKLGAPLGNNAYKIRIAVKSKGKGKRGGLRVITYLEIETFVQKLTIVFLLSIYDKSVTATLTKQEIKRLIENRNL